MSGPTTSRVHRSDLEEDASARAHAAIEEILAEARPIHDLNGDVVSSLLTFIGERIGDAAVEEAWRHVAEDCWRPVFEHFRASGDTAALAEALAGFLKSHRYDFEAWEDDEAWYFEVAYCTSGERLIREGKVRGILPEVDGHHRFGVTANAHPWSFDRAGLPYYDVHSALWMRILPGEWGWDVIDCEYAERADGVFTIARYIVRKAPR